MNYIFIIIIIILFIYQNHNFFPILAFTADMSDLRKVLNDELLYPVHALIILYILSETLYLNITFFFNKYFFSFQAVIEQS